ncbi:hypothetical protein lerEdw1_006214 [Lerista edwardsae]|nr:hypothetical protein lerEdw1_006214 [Lerista edwardsae]
MGIQGLLQFIRDAAEPAHVKKYKGQVVAVDTYCWLHKGAYACSEKLAKGEPTDQYVAYCMKLVDMLLSFGVKPILVFDGCTLPSKKEVEKTRREKRQTNLLKGKQLLREGKLSEARECFARSINITHAMAHEVIKVARAQGIDCIVAPYEADAQLAYLNKSGIVQAVITEDSDLLAFGCKKVFLKIDKFGNGLEIDQARLGMCKQLGDVFTEEKFRYMCILSGCDYLPSIHGIGLGKACRLLKIANNPDITKIIGKMGQYLKMNLSVPEDYIQGFIRANNTFLYQLVFDPVRRKLVPLNAYEDGVDPETLLYAGKHLGDGNAFQIALGNKDINTMEQIDDYNPDASQSTRPRSRGWNENCLGERPSYLKSIWSRDYKPDFTVQSASHAEVSLEKPTTRGIERVVNMKGLKRLRRTPVAKRARDEGPSEEDLLNQYSLSNSKKPKVENTEGSEQHEVVGAESVIHSSKDLDHHKESPNSQPRLRNKFALALHKKNEESGAVFVPGTRSRFFCRIADAPDDRSKGENCQPSQGNEVDCQSLEAESAISENSSAGSPEAEGMERTISPSLGTPLGASCFSWSRNFADSPGTPSPPQGVTLLKQFLWQAPSKATAQECKRSGPQTLSPIASNESHDQSSPLKKSGCLLEEESDKLSQSSPNPSPHSSGTNEDAIGARVPGLYKTRSLKSHVVTKCKSLMPAKVSGLSKKMASAKKENHHNAENKSGLQVTINDLWKSFQFKRESERLPSCTKSEPLSPVKDNIQLTPDADDCFNKHEFSHAQRKIFQ